MGLSLRANISAQRHLYFTIGIRMCASGEDIALEVSHNG